MTELCSFEKRKELDRVQDKLDRNPNVIEIREDESVLLKAFNNAMLDDEIFLKQKAKVLWLKEGDGNTSFFFHKVVKGRRNRNQIPVVQDALGNFVYGEMVSKAFVSHYSL